ncbi:hypothetical protein PHLGIDRAFT_42215, partial [Phlebiopsis gigantea 11061_1 CR5-6]
LLPMLGRLQKAFFDKLDNELDKVEAFYLEREKEMRARTTTLKAQLQELQDHRRLFHVQIEHADGSRAAKLTRTRHSEDTAVHVGGSASPSASATGGSGGSGPEESAPNVTGWKRVRHKFDKHNAGKTLSRETSGETPMFKYDPDDYLQAKKKLKKAVLECYRGLELLENYRTLNLIGFRKALKKFEKYTKIPALQTYFTEKIDPSAFSSGAAVQGMLGEMEHLYAARFTQGNNKLAKNRLRGLAQHKTHHFSSFRTGMLLGLAIPAFVDGLCLSIQFADFWMGDQFCSLVFTISNFYFLGCAYSGGFGTHWTQCMTPTRWGVPFVLASLPLLARLVQSIRRWVDSKLMTHLINGGKYGAGIVYYFFYFNWRHQGGARGYSFVLWCIFGVIYATYATAWDLLMDWSVLRPRAPHRFLRPELIYNNTIPLYYLAIITNVLIRFVWVIYIPQNGLAFPLRAFIAAILEMFRRWQWNFYRLENEHLGNVDQYRVTREVPLPYTFDDHSHETDIDEDDARSM